jgi:glycine cleavage system H protein
MNETKYTKDHEWVLMDGDDIGIIGITHYAQEQLGDIVFIELPELQRETKQGEDIAVIESVKAASDLKAPLSGQIIEVNSMLSDAPETVNSDPLGEGWIMKIRISDPSEFENLLNSDAYQQLIDS